MKTSQFTAAELSLITTEAKDCGFPDAESFLAIEAGVYRLAVLNNSGYFDGKIEAHDVFSPKIEQPAMALKPRTFENDGMASCYHLFSDGSLYLESNGEDEVWASAEDFASEHLLDDPVSLNRAERKLLRALGGRFKGAVDAAKKEARYNRRKAMAVPLNFSNLLPGSGSDNEKYSHAASRAREKAAERAKELGLDTFSNSHNTAVGSAQMSFEAARDIAKRVGIDTLLARPAEAHGELLAWARIDNDFVVGLIGDDWQARPNSHYVAVAYAPLEVMVEFFGKDAPGCL